MKTEAEEHWRLRLIELITHLKVTQRGFSDATGIDVSYVSRLLYPPGKKGRKNLGLTQMTVIRNSFNLPAGWFDLPLGQALPLSERAAVFDAKESQQSSNALGAARSATVKYAFRAGVVQGGDNGFIELYESTPTLQDPEPIPYVSTKADERAYAVKVRGNSMEPTIMAGWDVVASPARAAEPPDLCVVHFTNERKALKRLLWVRDGMVCLESLNAAHQKITEPIGNIIRMDKVISIVPN